MTTTNGFTFDFNATITMDQNECSSIGGNLFLASSDAYSLVTLIMGLS